MTTVPAFANCHSHAFHRALRGRVTGADSFWSWRDQMYSLASVLESHSVEVLHAESGAEGIRLLEANPDIDIALVDIMMPEMDGYETMGQIRADPDLSGVPLIAVTAKAMKGDRQKCLDAGASDYIAKPVDIELLLALLRVWISDKDGPALVAEPLVTDQAAE